MFHKLAQKTCDEKQLIIKRQSDKIKKNKGVLIY